MTILLIDNYWLDKFRLWFNAVNGLSDYSGGLSILWIDVIYDY